MNKTWMFYFAFIFYAIKIESAQTPWNENYQKMLMEKVSEKVPILATYPSLIYPNKNYQEIVKKYPGGKVLLFGYGSLINAISAAHSMSPEAVNSMKPVIAFGFKRIFNYKANNVSRWGSNLPKNERAMLNIIPTTTYQPIINGVTLEVSERDLIQLIQREIGYDLVPMLVTSWENVKTENPSITLQIAYTFLVPDEMRNGVDYTQTMYYPVRGYLDAVRKGASRFGENFLNYWNNTTYLSDGTTPINAWNERTFSGILDTKE